MRHGDIDSITLTTYKISVNLMAHKVALTILPTMQHVLGQERPDNHSRAIMHPSSCIELTHRGVNDGVSCTAGTPCFELGGVVTPWNGHGVEFEGLTWGK